jgi:hypothetical protein
MMRKKALCYIFMIGFSGSSAYAQIRPGRPPALGGGNNGAANQVEAQSLPNSSQQITPSGNATSWPTTRMAASRS